MADTSTTSSTDIQIAEIRGKIDTLLSIQSKPPSKGLVDYVAPISTFLSTVVIGAAVALSTHFYNAKQIKIEQLEKIDTYRVYLQSSDFATRTFGYHALLALGDEQFVARIIGSLHDPAGATALIALTEKSQDKSTIAIAQDNWSRLPEEIRLWYIVNIFELGRPQPDYSRVSVVQGDTGHLAYGASQTTLGSGNLALLVRTYVQREDSRYGSQLSKYLDRLDNRDFTLDSDEEFKSLLIAAGNDQIMQDVQFNFFKEVYLEPAMRWADELGVKLSLGKLAIYDSAIQGSLQKIIAETISDLGGTPATGVNEQDWIKAFLEKRKSFLSNHSIPLMRRTIYRPEALLKLADQGNWNLIPPISINGIDLAK